MRILILASRYPESLVGGYEGKLSKLIEGYHRHGHIVDIMGFVPRLDKVNRELVGPYCDHTWLFEDIYVPSRRSLRRWFLLLCSLDRTSLQRSSRLVVKQLQEVLIQHRPDVIQIDGYSMLQYRPYIGDIPCIAFPADCATLALERERNNTTCNLWQAIRMANHVAKVRHMEGMYTSFYATLFVAQPDAERARQLSPGANILHVTYGVDVDYFQPTEQSVEPTTMVFHGCMNFAPNVEAAVWFITEVWPGLKRRRPQSRFLVVGANPAEQILSAANGDPNIVVTGLVPDVRPYLQQASVVVVPMQTGTGVKNKALEGMAMAKPVVMTSMAAAGLEAAIPGQHFLAADSPAEFVDVICGLWDDPQRARRIGASARELVKKNHSWESMQDACELLLRQAASGVRPPVAHTNDV